MEDPRKFYIENFKIIDNFVLQIFFRDGKVQTVDFQKVVHKGDWVELNDLNYFNKVQINRESENLEWPNRQDFNPEHLYYWEKFSKYYEK